MKTTKIRKGVFETNSSSSHSISIATADKQFVLDTSFMPEEDGVLRLYGGEFGWEWNKINDSNTKANYCAVCAIDDDYKSDMLIEVLQEQTGAKDVEFAFNKEGYGNYIDHQSYDVPLEAFKSKETLRNFIFNLNSWLFTGNYNSSQPRSYYFVDEYRDGKVIPPTYKFEMSIPGISKTSKFVEKMSEEDIQDGLDEITENFVYIGDGKFVNRNEYYEKVFSPNVWQLPIDSKNQIIYFINDNKVNEDSDKKFFQENGRKPNLNYQDKNNDWKELQKIKDKLIKSKKKPYVEKVSYLIRDMRTDLAKERLKNLEIQ